MAFFGNQQAAQPPIGIFGGSQPATSAAGGMFGAGSGLGVNVATGSSQMPFGGAPVTGMMDTGGFGATSAMLPPAAFGSTNIAPAGFGSGANAMNTSFGSTNFGSAFGSAGVSSGGAFTSNGFGQHSNVTGFTSSGFGSSVNNASNAFTASTICTQGNTGFGATGGSVTQFNAGPFTSNNFGQTQSSGSTFTSGLFGQTSNAQLGTFGGSASGFGNTQNGGTAAFTTSGFGQSAPASITTGFGQPASATTTTSAFGQPPATSTPSFGSSTNTMGTAGGFTSGGFGGQSTTGFGTFGQSAQQFNTGSFTSNGFGQNKSTNSISSVGLGQQQSQTVSGFGSSSLSQSQSFNTGSFTSNGFGKNTEASTSFGQPNTQSNTASDGFGQSSAAGGTGSAPAKPVSMMPAASSVSNQPLLENPNFKPVTATLFENNIRGGFGNKPVAPKIEPLTRPCNAKLEPWMEMAYAAKKFEEGKIPEIPPKI
ncbi:zinc finger C-x8-C-x5-C-x3-H type protein, putative [Babesia ovata]|uniref:Zinc finger C-x8-C-x5-C-x3-H type protein, putative n=1 Tax=Babesia ovata TaxID=189622 RepID=A0A2H6KF13_9APIC|nr:zinc finger C-x8-C-x5-C-x3-H type protein, putative [Babesia ovata]GBE61576.1 zinc finger C-x8-C-x5-C-x3-H type protein, putative [Babesia ovata]